MLAGWRDQAGAEFHTVLVVNDRLQLDLQLSTCVVAFWEGRVCCMAAHLACIPMLAICNMMRWPAWTLQVQQAIARVIMIGRVATTAQLEHTAVKAAHKADIPDDIHRCA